jgi:hypothetical protein
MQVYAALLLESDLFYIRFLKIGTTFSNTRDVSWQRKFTSCVKQKNQIETMNFMINRKSYSKPQLTVLNYQLYRNMATCYIS